MALDWYLKDPNDGITEWPKWPELLQCPLEKVADHPWSHHGQPSQDGGVVPAATEDTQMDGEEEVTEPVDKGKGRDDEVSSSQAAGGEEVRASHHGHGCGQTRGHSQSHRPHKHVKSAPIVDSEEEQNPTSRGSNKTFDLQHPPPDFLILPAVDWCDYYAHRQLPCARKEYRACFQCNKSKHGCSLASKRGTSRSRSHAPTRQANHRVSPPSKAAPLAPMRINPPRSTCKRKAQSPIPADDAPNPRLHLVLLHLGHQGEDVKVSHNILLLRSSESLNRV